MSLKEVYDWYAKEGYLRARRQGGLTLYEYTPKTVYEGNWNHHTMTARGLILDDRSRVVARPFVKFFNVNERPETRFESLPAETPELSEKYDGSLLVVFENPETGRWQSVTRGSWDNIQTRFANDWLKDRSGAFESGWTHLFELVAPWNRIVVSYDRAEMILVGLVHRESTEDRSYAEVARYAAVRGLMPLAYEVRPLSGLDLEAPEVVNREGYVARFPSGLRVKLKYAQYVRLHRILTMLSVKDIWESLSQEKNLDLGGVPAEFLEWFGKETLLLEEKYSAIEREARQAFSESPSFGTRKEYAFHFQKLGSLAPILFRMLDKHGYSDLIWKKVKPSLHRVFKPDSPPG